MNLETLQNDIPREVAYAAHAGTSFVPERRAEQRQSEYAETLRSDYKALAKLADTDEKRATLDEEFERYRAGYKRRTLDYLHSSSRIVSTMIAGPSNFPVRQMEKRNDAAHKRLNELCEYRPRALDAIRKKLCPELRPIMAGDSDATDRLAAKIAEAEALQQRMRDVNAAHKKYLKNPASLEKSGLPEADQERIKRYKPAYSWEPHPFAPFELSNNNANIKRMQARLAQISQAKTVEASEVSGEHARIEDSPADNRVRLYFPGKPELNVRTRLKSFGFRWAPSLGCWQAYRNSRSLSAANEIAGVA